MKKKFAVMTIVLIAAVLPFYGCAEAKKKEKNSAPIYTQTGQEIIFNCIAAYFQTDGSKYFTEQNHTVWPNEQTIIISAEEPQGQFVWSYTNGEFVATGGREKQSLLKTNICDAAIAKGLLAIYTANIVAPAAGSGREVKLDGRWFVAVSSDNKTYYKRPDSGIVEMIQFTAGEQTYLVRGYNFQTLTLHPGLVPTKIEIWQNQRQIAEYAGRIQNL